MASTTQTAAALMPITVAYGETRIDLSVPGAVPLAELLPGLLQAHSRLDTAVASQGVTVLTTSGDQLDQSRSLPQQGVRAGALLTLRPIGTQARDRRYDDLVEAVGTTVEETQAPWTRSDSLALSAHAAAALVLVAAILLATGSTNPVMTAVIGGVGALLVALGASVVARVPALPGALALVHTAPVLASCAATALAPGDWTGSTLLAAGTGVLLASPCVLALPAPLWPTTAAPLTVGGALTATGTLTSVLGTPPSRAGAAVLTLLVVLSLAAPWIAMAQVPVRVTGASTSAPVDAPVLAARVAHSHALVLALKAGSCTACLVLAPLLLTDPSGLALLVCTGVALMLATRSLRSRAEVLMGVVTGMLLTLLAAVAVALGEPRWLPAVVGAVAAVAVLLLAANVVSERTRPWLTRAADTVSVLSLLAIPPLAALIWGVL